MGHPVYAAVLIVFLLLLPLPAFSDPQATGAFRRAQTDFEVSLTWEKKPDSKVTAPFIAMIEKCLRSFNTRSMAEQLSSKAKLEKAAQQTGPAVQFLEKNSAAALGACIDAHDAMVKQWGVEFIPGAEAKKDQAIGQVDAFTRGLDFDIRYRRITGEEGSELRKEFDATVEVLKKKDGFRLVLESSRKQLGSMQKETSPTKWCPLARGFIVGSSVTACAVSAVFSAAVGGCAAAFGGGRFAWIVLNDLVCK